MRLEILALLGLSSLAVACAPAREPRYARLRDLGVEMKAWDPSRPLVIEVDEGDTIPLHFSLEGPLFATLPDAPPLTLRAKRHFYLRVSRDGLQSSFDKNDFGARPVRPGSFQIGIGATKDGPLATVAIRTPTPPEPSK